MKLFKLALIILLVVLSCKQPADKDYKSEQEIKRVERELVDVNRILVQKEDEAIRKYIQRRGWEMKKSETGMYYSIYKKGSGDKAAEGKKITFEYTLELLDGTLCYSSKEIGNKVFTIGKGGVESGLEEAVLLLHEGDKAKVILPPHLAHGLIGDENCIPARSTIVYDINVLNIE